MQNSNKIRYLFPFKIISNPKIFADGKTIVYTLTSILRLKNKYKSNIWVRENGEDPKQCTSGNDWDTNPLWSRDGKSIYFVSNRPKHGHSKTNLVNRLWKIPRGGGEAEILVDRDVQSPRMFQNEDKILFKSEVDLSHGTCGSDVRVITHAYYKEEGRGFIENKRNHIFFYGIKDHKLTTITEGNYDVEHATISPDGKSIVFIANMDDDADFSPYNSIYRVSVSGGKPQLLYNGNIHWGSVDWSPDGDNLVISGQEIKDPTLAYYQNSNLWVLPMKGGNPRNISKKFDRSVYEDSGLIKWSNDSNNIYFLADDLGSTHLFNIDLKEKIFKISRGKITVSDFSLGEKDELVYVASESNSLQELWYKHKGEQSKITRITENLLEGRLISKAEEFWFKSRGGARVQGWIIKPTNFDGSKKYPTVLSIHGGPFMAYTYGLRDEFQVLSDNGYGVVYTNPRGSTGYGQRFAECILEDFQEEDYDDLIKAIEFVTSKYKWVDREKLGIIGGSYGGSMTTWTIGRTNLFKAAVSERGYSNLISFVGTSDTAWKDLPKWIAGKEEAWDNPKKFMEKSPLGYIRKIDTPLLLIYGESDSRNPIEQGEQMFTGLKKLKKTVEFVRFPNEGHGLPRTGSPEHRKVRLFHILRWFEKYLK